MRSCVILLLCLFPAFVAAQVYDRDAQTRLMKDTIGTIAARKKPKLEIVTRDMRRLEGKLVGIYPDHFVIQPKEKKPLVTIAGQHRTKYYHPKYSDILQLESKGVALSFVPDPNLAPFATMDSVGELGVGIPVEIILNDGTRRYGVFLSDENNSIKVMRGNTQIETSKDRIAKIYMVTGDSSSFMQKIVSGGGKGAEVTDDIFPLLNPRVHADPVIVGIGAAIGALIYILPKREGARVLVYAR